MLLIQYYMLYGMGDVMNFPGEKFLTFPVSC